ncbi:MAG: SRPBCC family protein [Solirubrobacteraceae bacterium]|jgi:uncharacterized protein YndB with AHSA1/START domain
MSPATRSHSAEISLPSDTQILVTRKFDAPRHLVYKAWTTPEHVRQWWTANRGEMTVAEIDLRVGGKWRYAMDAHHGGEVAFHGEYLEIVPDERLVTTEVYEGAPEAPPARTEMTLTESDGVTTVTLLVTHGDQMSRDMHARSMPEGLQDALDTIEELLPALAG